MGWRWDETGCDGMAHKVASVCLCRAVPCLGPVVPLEGVKSWRASQGGGVLEQSGGNNVGLIDDRDGQTRTGTLEAEQLRLSL